MAEKGSRQQPQHPCTGVSTNASENILERDASNVTELPIFIGGREANEFILMPQLLMNKSQLDTAYAAIVDDKVAVGYRDEESSSEKTKTYVNAPGDRRWVGRWEIGRVG